MGYQWPDIYPGFDVAAISDSSPEFPASCGRCYEVKCRNTVLTDGYGESIDRSSVCFDDTKSVVVRTVDNCPCQYPSNEYSNKRWCCGDAGAGSAHMDLSVWSFEKLASLNLGVIAISFREVPCNYVSSNPASTDDPSPPEQPWDGAKRPHEKIFVKRFDPTGLPQGAVSEVQDSGQSDGKPIVSATQLYRDGTLQMSEGQELSATTSDGGAQPEDVSKPESEPAPEPESEPAPEPESKSTAEPVSESKPAPVAESSAEEDCQDMQTKDVHTCKEHRDWGNCEEQWLIKDGLCAKTCGRCSPAGAEKASSKPTESQPDSTPAPTSSEDCKDAPPRDQFTCEQHKSWGNCEQQWLINDDLCAKTCGRC